MYVHPFSGSCAPADSPIEAQAIVNDGMLKALIGLDDAEEYWGAMLLDFPNHPASANPLKSLPIALYGALVLLINKCLGGFNCFCFYKISWT